MPIIVMNNTDYNIYKKNKKDYIRIKSENDFELIKPKLFQNIYKLYNRQIETKEYLDSYIEFIKNNERDNDKLPKIDKTKLRIMTYNVHGFTDTMKTPIDNKRFIEMIQIIQPSILCLQEVIFNHPVVKELGTMYEIFFVKLILKISETCS